MTELMQLRSVGDGMNFLIDNNGREDLTIDYGGNENVNEYDYFQDYFILSHFHADHYNGILSSNGQWYLSNFYYPAMPRFSDAAELTIAFLAMNIRTSKNHPIQNTVLTAIKKLNKTNVNFKALAKGEFFTCGGKRYEILWPPEELKENDALTDIRKAIKDFNTAKDADVYLQEIYRSIENKYKGANPYEVDVEEFSELKTSKVSMENTEIIKMANNSLRKAANRLSLVFRQEDNLLFLGDLESSEIKIIADGLIKESKTYYDILVAAHHGTHWHDELRGIECRYCLASVGKTLQKHVNYMYRDIAKMFLRTDELGDILIKKTIKVRLG